MRTKWLALGLLICFIAPATVYGQTVEMAAKCDALQQKLSELVKKTGSIDAAKIKESIGVDILDSCSTNQGQVVCFQCLDKDENLRTIQILRKGDSQKLEFLGFGCRCRDKK